MEAIVADLSNITFKIEHTLNRQIGIGGLMFAGMDKSNAEKCKYYLQKGGCSKGNDCPFRHSRGDKVVCKHWLRGLCKKSDMCEFLHEYDESKMPECYFYATYGECNNGEECQYRHIDAEAKIKDCPWYTRGFCKHGPQCRRRHTRKVICQNYLCGFCPDGPQCKLAQYVQCANSPLVDFEKAFFSATIHWKISSPEKFWVNEVAFVKGKKNERENRQTNSGYMTYSSNLPQPQMGVQPGGVSGR